MSGAWARPGAVSVAELILVATLFAVALTGVASFTAAQSRMATLQMERTRATELVRTASVVLEAELRYLDPDADIAAVSTDSVGLRAFRGSGVLCGRTGRALSVRYRGARLPEPAKDSVLVVTAAGDIGPFPIEAVVTGGCGLRLTVAGEPPDRGLVLVFEGGSYHLTGHALRYRRGRAGRQPLTEAVADSMGFDVRPGAIAARLGTRRDSLPRLRQGPIALRFVLLNGPGT